MATDGTADRNDSDAAVPSPRTPATPVCDNESIGVVITDTRRRVLLITRATPPVGRAPVAGHRDHHGADEDVARDEVSEEVGLTVTSLAPVIPRHWRDNICRRQPGPQGVGHYWTIYDATVTGVIRPDPAEAVDACWYTRDELQSLADRTVAYARGALSTTEFATDPGLLPVWMSFLAKLKFIRVARNSFDAIEKSARHLGSAYVD